MFQRGGRAFRRPVEREPPRVGSGRQSRASGQNRRSAYLGVWGPPTGPELEPELGGVPAGGCITFIQPNG